MHHCRGLTALDHSEWFGHLRLCLEQFAQRLDVWMREELCRSGPNKRREQHKWSFQRDVHPGRQFDVVEVLDGVGPLVALPPAQARAIVSSARYFLQQLAHPSTRAVQARRA
jgi:hypothetical protein